MSVCRRSKYNTLVGARIVTRVVVVWRTAQAHHTPTAPRRSRLAQAHGIGPLRRPASPSIFWPSPLQSALRSIIRAYLGDRTWRHVYEVRISGPFGDANACRSAVHRQFSATGGCHIRNDRLSVERSNLEERHAQQDRLDWPWRCARYRASTRLRADQPVGSRNLQREHDTNRATVRLGTHRTLAAAQEYLEQTKGERDCRTRASSMRLPIGNRSTLQLRSHRVIVVHDEGRKHTVGVTRREDKKDLTGGCINASHRRDDLGATSNASGGDDGGDDAAEVGAEDSRPPPELSQSFHPSCPRCLHRRASPRSGPKSGQDLLSPPPRRTEFRSAIAGDQSLSWVDFSSCRNETSSWRRAGYPTSLTLRRAYSCSEIDPVDFSRSSLAISSAALKPTIWRNSSLASLARA